jgi:PRTRC genetic system protein C
MEKIVLTSQPLERKFVFKRNGETIDLPDFNPLAPPQDIVKFYAGQYPELTNAKIETPKVNGNTITFNIGKEVGTLG